ncbi:hypothetical protein LZZ85_05595 [Terrimonas sp. NA20]|uniref:Uncharacterized protein n=1 Tax=Terrimonas ginsenosidimutans TaxID=2908004 RepID=A0ABS9KN50_9BACT|nr:hypothetical protein [Terrimonas ginsenosidimutans]MCG2613741.1 hypothetical protein [Terrimonas ginsenosidimutans]
MQKTILILGCFFLLSTTHAQFTYKIKADSVKITNDSCTAELILENSTKSVNGFLYNKGNGRTEFRKGLIKLNDTSYIIGADTLRFRDHGTGYILNRNNVAQTNSGFWVTQNSQIDGRLSINPPVSVPSGYQLVVGGNSITYGNARARRLQLVESPYEGQDYSAVNYGPSLNAIATLNITNGLTGSPHILLQGNGGAGGAVSHPMVFFGDNQKAYAAVQGITRGGWGIAQPFGDLAFHTAPDSSVFALLERMRLTSKGNLAVGTLNDQGFRINVVGGDIAVGGIRIGHGNGNNMENVAIGEEALKVNGTGNYLTAIGRYTLTSNTTGQYNTAIGPFVLRKNTTGYGNTAIAYMAMEENISGTNNTAVGSQTLRYNTSGQFNSAFGANALRLNTTGEDNTGLGMYALQNNTTGSYNTAVGLYAMNSNTTGTFNTAIGRTALNNNISGNTNAALGQSSLGALTTGDLNIGIGYQAGLQQTSGNGNIFIGTSTTSPASATASNQLNIGNWIYGQSGKIGINTTSPTARLTIAAGTDVGQTAPLKFTAGTNLATPENGAVEYNGTNYFVTSDDTRYTLAKTLTNTGSLNFPSTAANSSSDLTITINGAADGDAVSLGVPSAAVQTNSNYTAWVSAANTITIRFTNNDGSTAKDPATGTFRVTVLKY